MSSTIDWDVRPLTGAIGAEVIGPKLSRLDDRQWAELQSLWLEHLALFFPGQYLDADEHVALGRRFGQLEVHPFIPKLDDAHPEIVVLNSHRGGGKTNVWHTDVTFSATPPMASILYMQTCPPLGGDTMVTNQYLAYETLSPALKDLLEGLTAEHTAAPFGHPEITAVHPAVRIHPATGRRSLYVNRTFTSHFVELRRSESDALLQYLFSWSEQPNFNCRYSWNQGDIGIWDNRCTQHYAVDDYEDTRVLHRVTVLGDEPRGGTPRYAAFDDAGADRGLLDDGGPIAIDSRTNSVGH
jgi:taurine dioxygenase